MPHAVYYIVLRGNGDEAIYQDGQDFAVFSQLVSTSLRRSHCRLHAFCWLKNRALMALQIGDEPTGRFVQHVTAQYARYRHGKDGGKGHLFTHHHNALLVQRSKLLLHLMRYIHRAPVRAGVVEHASDYIWSSDLAYRVDQRIPWLTTHVVRDMLGHARRPGPMSYAQWMELEEDPTVMHMFEHGHKREPRAAGDDAFIAGIVGTVKVPCSDARLDEVIAEESRKHGVSLSSIYSPSRRRKHVLVRALIAWRATQQEGATLAQVGEKLCRDPSTLWSAIDRYQRLRPELFPENERSPGLDAEAFDEERPWPINLDWRL